MKKHVCFIFIIFPLILFSNTFEGFLDKEISHHRSASNLNVDAVFAYNVNRVANFETISTQFSHYQIACNTYHKFVMQTLPQPLVSKYCSKELSPELLAIILTHLSVYEYCIRNNIDRVLMVKSNVSIDRSPAKLNQLLASLDKIDRDWDIFFTDVDFHAKDGHYLTPKIKKRHGKILNNKVPVAGNISRVFHRYGTYSFIISQSGMKKVINYFKKNGITSAYDRCLFQIPHLKAYSPHVDIITNDYKSGRKNVLANSEEEIFFERKDYRIGEEFWIEPVELLCMSRFDVMAKYIYAKYYLNKHATNWHVSLYKNHIGKWNNFYEGDPVKVGFKDFRDSFHRLIHNLQEEGFRLDAEPVPINNRGILINGSHRVGTCLALNIPVRVKVVSATPKKRFKSFAFTLRDGHDLDTKFLDHMAYEYAKLKKNAYIVCAFPSIGDRFDTVEQVLSQYGDIVYSKDIFVTNSGSLEFIRLIYVGEGWVGRHDNNFRSGREKTKRCFPPELLKKYPVRVYLYECKDLTTVRHVKEQIRNLVNKGHDSVHINDKHAQTVTIAASVFNDNSIHCMNTLKLVPLENFDSLFLYIQNFMKKFELDPDHLCVDGSGVLSAYGLRDCRDMDILHYGKLPPDPEHKIDSHNGYLKYHCRRLDDILFNPQSYFFLRGVKFLKINLLKNMKKNRSEPKDLRDVQLIDTL